MPRESIKQILMRRDDMSESDAQELIDEAIKALNEYLADGEMDAAENICEEFFGLEPDYLDEIMPLKNLI